MAPRSVFRDESLLLPEYLPRDIPHRDEQLKKLEHYFRGVIENSSRASTNVIIHGPIGSGKTMIAKKLGESLQKKATLNGNLVKILHVNCRIDRSLQAVMVKALSSLGQNYPSRGYSFEELLTALTNELRENRMHLVIAFDEVDSLVLSDPSSLYTITRLREMSQGRQVFSSILISKTIDYLKKVDISTLSSLQWNEVALDAYPSDHLLDIIASREEAFNDGCFPEGSRRLAAEIAGMFGDARYALDLITRAGKLADMDESPRILPEHVRSAQAGILPSLRKEELGYLTKHQRLILMAVSAMLKKGDSAEVTIGEVEKSYGALCESKGIGPNHHTQVWNDVNELSRKGIIQTELSGSGRRGRTTLIGLDLVSARELMAELEKGMAAEIAS